MKLRDLLSETLNLSEKAACLARAIRAEHTLFDLLVQEKTGEDKNQKFAHDFKTLADVLVQETVRHDLLKRFPKLEGNIHGEESNCFTNQLGETIELVVQDSTDKTAELLTRVLNGNQQAAQLLAFLVHQRVEIALEDNATAMEVDIPDEAIGLWTDPIDSTFQYVQGKDSCIHSSGVYKQGLQSVTVLIGAYHRNTGLPVLGVINQPFHNHDPQQGRWTGRSIWGVAYGDYRAHSPSLSSNPSSVVRRLVVSGSESQQVKTALQPNFELISANGAGYKLLCVIDQIVQGYVTTKSFTYKWDTCSPHALLRSLGGGLLDCRRALSMMQESSTESEENLKRMLAQCQVTYHKPDTVDLAAGEIWSNSGGFLSYVNPDVMLSILKNLVHKV